MVKIESPGPGDYIRDHMGAIAPRHSPFHLYVNRNKRSLSLDLERADGQEVLRQLIVDADVFVTGFAADNPARLGMGYEQLRTIKPDIIYCQAADVAARDEPESTATCREPATDIGGVTARCASYDTADDRYILFCAEELELWRRRAWRRPSTLADPIRVDGEEFTLRVHAAGASCERRRR